MSVELTPASIWPPNVRMIEVTATIVASDDLDPAPRVQLVSIVGNDAKGRGAEVGDAAIGTDDRRFTVRASPDAVYPVMSRATDPAGNSTEAVASVVVGK